MNFNINNQEYFKARSSVHSTNTRNKHNFHRTANLLYFRISARYVGIEIFNSLPLFSQILGMRKHNFKTH